MCFLTLNFSSRRLSLDRVPIGRRDIAIVILPRARVAERTGWILAHPFELYAEVPHLSVLVWGVRIRDRPEPMIQCVVSAICRQPVNNALQSAATCPFSGPFLFSPFRLLAFVAFLPRRRGDFLLRPPGGGSAPLLRRRLFF